MQENVAHFYRNIDQRNLKLCFFLKVLLSQKECLVMHHTIHTPTPVPVETPERLNYNPVFLSIPRPSPIINHNDLKQGSDFSNQIEENTKESNVENILLVEKVEENQNQVDETHMSVQKTFVDENIQAIETSSNKVLEKSIEVNNLESETIPVEKIENIEEQQSKTTKQEHDMLIHDLLISQNSSEVENKNDPNVSNVIHQSAFSNDCNGTHSSAVINNTESNETVSENTACRENEIKTNILNGSRHKQSTVFSTSRKEVRNRRRRHSLNTHSRNTLMDTGSLETKTYVNSRLKSRSTKVSVTNNMVEEGVKNSTNKTSSSAIGKRRHSAISQSVINTVEESCILQEPCVKRRTRSEDRPNPVDENDPANQATKDASGNLSWTTTESNITRSTAGATTVPVQERLSSLNNFQRNLGKKATPVKTIRRPSIKGLLKQLWAASLSAREWDQGRSNRSNNCNERRINRTMSIIGSSDNTTVPQRWLRLVFLSLNFFFFFFFITRKFSIYTWYFLNFLFH